MLILRGVAGATSSFVCRIVEPCVTRCCRSRSLLRRSARSCFLPVFICKRLPERQVLCRHGKSTGRVGGVRRGLHTRPICDCVSAIFESACGYFADTTCAISQKKLITTEPRVRLKNLHLDAHHTHRSTGDQPSGFEDYSARRRTGQPARLLAGDKTGVRADPARRADRSTVMIMGESGSGKELVAECIHAAQPSCARADGSRSTAARFPVR